MIPTYTRNLRVATLERIVDSVGVVGVLDLLADVCSSKADRTGDEEMAACWREWVIRLREAKEIRK